MSSPPMIDPVLESDATSGVERVEALRSRLAATFDDAPTAAAGTIDRSNPFRAQGFLSAKTAVEHMWRLSGPEAHRRVQTPRLHAALPAWGDAEADGTVGVARSELMARIAANPRIASAVLERDAPALLDDAVNAALIGHIRRVVYDASGTVIDLGRRSRLFRGNARDAVMLLLTTCIWIGCDRPIAWCDADHSLGWTAHGATVPRNGGGLCEGHRHLKDRGFHVYRDDHGDWHVIDPNGNEIT